MSSEEARLYLKAAQANGLSSAYFLTHSKRNGIDQPVDRPDVASGERSVAIVGK